MIRERLAAIASPHFLAMDRLVHLEFLFLLLDLHCQLFLYIWDLLSVDGVLLDTYLMGANSLMDGLALAFLLLFG